MLEEQDIKQIRTVVKEEIGGLKQEIGGLKQEMGEVKKGVEELGEAIQTLATHVDKRFDAVDKRFYDTDKSIDQKIGKLRSEVIDNVTRIVNNAKGDLVKAIRTERERAKLFDTKVLLVLERSKLVAPEEAIAMRELVM